MRTVYNQARKCLPSVLFLFGILACSAAQAVYRFSDADQQAVALAIYNGSLESLKKIVNDRNTANASIDNRSIVYLAVQQGHQHILEYLLELGADPNTVVINPTSGRYSPLVLIAMKHGELASMLVEAGADVEATNSNGSSWLLLSAVLRNDEKLVTLLVERGASLNRKSTVTGMTALHVAANNANTAMYDYLVDHGADEMITNDFGLTPKRLLETRSNGEAAKQTSSEDITAYITIGNVEAVKTILAAGGDPNASYRGATLLMRAVHAQQPGIVEMLLDQGADPNLLSTRERHPLYEAVLKADVESVTLLLSSGANPTLFLRPYRRSAWVYCFNHGNAHSCIDSFLAAGLSVEAVDPRTGNTPLHQAVSTENVEAAKYLLEQGADPSLRNQRGLSVYDAVERKNNPVITMTFGVTN